VDSTRIPAEFLFTMDLDWLESNGQDFLGPFGPRKFRCVGSGTVSGPRFNGHVVRMAATDFGRVSLDGTIRHIDSNIVVDADDGESILLQVRGRMSPRYGDGNSRLQIVITSARGKHEWLGERQAVGVGRTEGGRWIVDVYALVIPDEAGATAGDHEFEGKLILCRQSQHNPDAKHRIIAGPFGARYISVADDGGAFDGPLMSGTYPAGFAWSPHRVNVEGGIYYMHHDVNTLIVTDDGVPVLMNYTGLNSPQTPNGNWRSAVMFEAPEGKYAWLNEIFAIGVGKATGGGAQYHVYDFE
jgi:hypothetical protein